MCVFWGALPYLGEKHTNKIPRKSRGNPVKILFVSLCVCVFFSSVVCFAPNNRSRADGLICRNDWKGAKRIPTNGIGRN